MSEAVQKNLELLQRMSPYWDLHMTFPVVDWLENHQFVDAEEIRSCRRELLAGTCIVKDGYTENSKKKEIVENEIKLSEKKVENFLNAIKAYKKEQQKRMGGYPERKSIPDLSDWWMRQEENPNKQPLSLGIESTIPHLARLYYNLGDYSNAMKYLKFFLTTLNELTVEGTNIEKRVWCLWGLSSCIILTHPCEPPTEEGEKKEEEKEAEILGEEDGIEGSSGTDISSADKEARGGAQALLKIGEILDFAVNANPKQHGTYPSSFTSRKEQLFRRCWVVHWSFWPIFRYYLLMIYTKHDTPRHQVWGMLLEWILQERTMTCVQSLAPHLLRYYAVYAILNRKRKDHFMQVVHAIGSCKNKYSDPFTSLLEALFLDFNFDQAQQHIAQIQDICSSDFLLDDLTTSITEHARLLIFETYCRIHKCINVDMIAKKLNMSPEAAERWIVNLIRHARLEARIDSEKNRVEMCVSNQSLYQQVMEKTRNLCIRSNLLFQNLHRPSHKDAEDSNYYSQTRGRGRGRGRQWMRGDDFFRGGAGGGRRGRGGRGRSNRRDPMAAAAASLSGRRHDDTAFNE